MLDQAKALGEDINDPTVVSKLKKKANKSFSCKSKNGVRDLYLVCFYLDLFDRPGASDAIHLLTKCGFSGNFDTWSFIEAGLALSARRERLRNNPIAREIAMQRISMVGFVDERLQGVLLPNIERNLVNAQQGRLESTDKKVVQACRISEMGWRERLGMELNFIIEHLVGKSDTSSLEEKLSENLSALRSLCETTEKNAA